MASNQYVTNIPKVALNSVCADPLSFYSDEDLMKMYTGGVASETLTPDASTGRVPVAVLQAYIQHLEGTGALKKRPTQKVGDRYETDMDKLVAQDTELYKTIQSEFCFYEQRFRYALKIFLQKATSRDSTDNMTARAMLTKMKILNIRMNSVIEVMNYLAQNRVPITNRNKDAINKLNKQINEKYIKTMSMFKMLQNDQNMVRTQREMVRYTEEKNQYTTNQIGLWAALNVVALATIFYVYRN